MYLLTPLNNTVLTLSTVLSQNILIKVFIFNEYCSKGLNIAASFTVYVIKLDVGIYWLTCVVKDKSSAPWKFEWNFTQAMFKQILVIDGWGNYCELALRWMSLVLADDKLTLV